MLLKFVLSFLIITTFITKNSSAQVLTENLVLVTVDGLRWKEICQGADKRIIKNNKYVADVAKTESLFWSDDVNSRRKKLFPFIWSTLASQGQIYGNRDLDNKVSVANNRWFSYPGYNELLTGKPDKRITSNEKKMNPNQTILEYVNQQNGFKNKVAAFASWDVFHYIINTKRSGVYVNAGSDTAKSRLTARERYLNHWQRKTPSPWGTTRFDKFTHSYAMEYLKKNSPRLLFIAYGETDEFAHHGKYDSYLQSSFNTDTYIKNLWEYLQSDPRYKNKTTLIITTDHGRGKGRHSWRSHSVWHTGSNHTWFAIIGPDTPALGEMKINKSYYTSQIAKTISRFLNLNYPDKGEVEKELITAFSK